MIERVIRTLKEQCVDLTCPQQHAMRVIVHWIQFHNHRRNHQTLGMNIPAEAYTLGAGLCRSRWINTRSRPTDREGIRCMCSRAHPRSLWP